MTHLLMKPGQSKILGFPKEHAAKVDVSKFKKNIHKLVSARHEYSNEIFTLWLEL